MFILKAIRNVGRSSPLTIALLIQFAMFSLFIWSIVKNGTVDATAPSGQTDISYVIDALSVEATVAGLILLIILALGWGKATYLTTRIDGRGVKWGATLVGVIAFFAIAVFSLLATESTVSDWQDTTLKLALFCIAVGVFEELLFRGTLFHGLSRHMPPFWAMMISSAIFGVFHMQNIAIGQDMLATAFQSLNAFGLGVLFCAIMLQTNSIWWAVALHAVWDFFLFLSAYIMQTQPELLEMTPADVANQASDLSLSALWMPAVFLALGLLIFARWRKRMRAAT